MRVSQVTKVFLPALLLFTGCSQSPKPSPEAKKEAEKPLDPLTGRQAFQQMYPSARTWARDAQPFQVENATPSDPKAAKGTATGWQATFVSVSQHRSKMISWYAEDSGALIHKGVFAGPDQDWTPSPSADTEPFEITAIRIDTDAALETALQQKATEAYIKKNPDKPVLYILEKTRRFPDLAWRVVWGESVGTSDFSVFIDATTGKYLQTMH